MACTLGDLLIRRVHVAFETRDNGRAAARKVAAFLGWVVIIALFVLGVAFIR